MRIEGRDLFKIVPSAGDKIPNGQAVGLTRRSYCARVHTAGYCTQDCDNCALSLVSAYQRFNSSVANKPAGLLTCILRDLATKHIEAAREQEKSSASVVETDQYDTPTNRNPFIQVAQQLQEA